MQKCSYLHLIFEKLSLMIFLCSLNWIFTACVACNIQVQKIQFIKLDFSISSAEGHGDK
jgi:hypothetical protein